MAQPLLDLGNVRLVVERVGGGRRPQSMSSDFKPQLRRVVPDQFINAIRRNRFFLTAVMGIAQRTEEGTLVTAVMPGLVQVVLDQIASDAVKRNVSRLLTFPRDAQMPDAAAFVQEIPDGEFAKFFAPERMVKQGCEDGPIPNAFERFLGWRDEQFARLMIGKRRRFTLVRFGPWTLHAFDGVVRDCILVTEILE